MMRNRTMAVPDFESQPLPTQTERIQAASALGENLYLVSAESVEASDWESIVKAGKLPIDFLPLYFLLSHSIALSSSFLVFVLVTVLPITFSLPLFLIRSFALFTFV